MIVAAGEYTDAETGFQYLRARYYDPSTGQFLTRDPIASITQEPYSYASNNPINVTDLTGMCPWCIAIGVGILVGGGIDLGSQMFDNAREDCGLLDDINWGSVAVWGGVGGVTGGLGHWVKGSGRLAQIRWADDVGAVGRRFSADEQALNAIVKGIRGPISIDDANRLLAWADELGVRAHRVMTHPGRTGFWSHRPHIKIFGRRIEVAV
jgi:RHS repeat-associated protein